MLECLEGTHLAENDTLPDRQIIVELHQHVILGFFIRAIHVKLLDPLDGKFFLSKHELVGVGCESFSERSYAVVEGRREENDLRLGWEHPNSARTQDQAFVSRDPSHAATELAADAARLAGLLTS